MQRTLTSYLLVAVAMTAAACATQSMADPVPVTHMTVSDVVAEGTELPSGGYLTTGQPDAATLDAIAAADYAAVIDFRGPNEDRGIDEQTEVTARGMQYFAIPVTGNADVTFDNATMLNDILDGIDGPVLLHCKSGNRAAAILALREKQNGASSEVALQYGVEAGLTRHRKIVEQRLGEKPGHR